MQDSWDRIRTWFKLHAPLQAIYFQPGATDHEIRQAEAALHIKLPDDITASYRLHNGSSRQRLIGDPQLHNLWGLLSLEEVVNAWNNLKHIIEDLRSTAEDPDLFREGDFHPLGNLWWHPKWIPLLELGDGDMLCVDLAPEAGGTRGRVISWWHDDSSQNQVIAPSWQVFLARFADDLEMGEYSPEFRRGRPPARYVLDEIRSGVFVMSYPRQRQYLSYPLTTPLIFPLTYPDSQGEFYGYDRIPASADTPSSTLALVDTMLSILRLVLTLEIGLYLADEKKARSIGEQDQYIHLCKEYLLDDRRIQLATTIYIACRGAWEQALPTRAQDREQLRGFCRDTLALENEYLSLCRNYILTQLQRGEREEKAHAAHILKSIVYRDDELVATLQALIEEDDEEVRFCASQALEAVEQSKRTMLS
jgi:cell wall assembly regulator SMI1